MTTTFDEGFVRFTFGRDWNVIKWDGEPAYRKGIGALADTRAVDFVALLRSEPWLIEVKDFRDHRIENKGKLSSGLLARQVAEKVRDTLAGMLWACGRKAIDPGHMPTFVHRFINREKKLPVVLWLDEDIPPTPAYASNLAESLRKELIWLNAHVIVTSVSLAQRKPIDGLSASNLSRIKKQESDVTTNHLIECLWFHWLHRKQALVNGDEVKAWCKQPRDRNNQPIPPIDVDVPGGWQLFEAALAGQKNADVLRWKEGPHQGDVVWMSLSNMLCAPAYQAAKALAQPKGWIEGHTPPSAS
jgi:hypothetical protein